MEAENDPSLRCHISEVGYRIVTQNDLTSVNGGDRFLDVTHLLLSADYYFNDGFSFITLFPLGIVKVAITADVD